jgi:hypothetical protein
MNKMKLVLIAAAALAGVGFASSSVSARTVCDQDGRCWNGHRNGLAVLAPFVGQDQGYGSREYIGRREGSNHRRHRHFQDPGGRGYDELELNN